jgi:hypothetical protein
MTDYRAKLHQAHMDYAMAKEAVRAARRKRDELIRQACGPGPEKLSLREVARLVGLSSQSQVKRILDKPPESGVDRLAAALRDM